LDLHCITTTWKGEIITANVPYTSYLSQKEHSFIKKCNFCDDLNFRKKTVLASKGLKHPLEKNPG
jgi:hypothetical protein